MYRIRRQSGDEITLASMDELAAAVAAGRVTADAEIYHQRAERWLSIASHPHFKLASERVQATARPASPPPVSAPAASEPAGEAGAPALRLMKNDDGSAGPRVTARWKEPPRLVKQPVALRAPSSAVPAPAEPVEERAPEPPAPEPAESPKAVRTHVERATDGLPLLDVGALPPLPPRATVTAPRTGPLFDKSKLGIPTPMPQRAPTPKPNANRAATPRPAARPQSLDVPVPAPKPDASRKPTPTSSPLPAPKPEAARPATPTPAPRPEAARVPTPMPARMPTPAPAPVLLARPMMAEPEESLDVPPPVRDFSAPYAPPAKVEVTPEPVVALAPRVPTPLPSHAPFMPPMPEPESARAPEPVAEIEPEVAHAPAPAPWLEPEPIELIVDAAVADAPAFDEPLPSFESTRSPSRARWAMLVGAVAVVAGAGFMMLRPRTSVETLAPQRVEARRAASRPSAVTPAAAQTVPGTAAGMDASGRAPAYVVELPDAPPPGTTPPTDTPEPVVPAAPKLSGIKP
ncbi:MAG TPA: hypothetical protein VFX50_10315, partial [Gemmatimonadales bacterium]|nr:hypothetical protein [Gemmatimonadales bacterium]